MAYGGTTDDSIELVRHDTEGPSVADAPVRIDVEEAETAGQHGISAGHVHKNDSARTVWDGAAERASRGRDIYWVSMVGVVTNVCAYA